LTQLKLKKKLEPNITLPNSYVCSPLISVISVIIGFL